jgi:hypothetical protein
LHHHFSSRRRNTNRTEMSGDIVFLLASWEEAPQCLASSSPGYLQLTAATRDLALLLSGPKEGLAFRFALPVIAPLMFRPSITVSAGMEVLARKTGCAIRMFIEAEHANGSYGDEFAVENHDCDHHWSIEQIKEKLEESDEIISEMDMKEKRGDGPPSPKRPKEDPKDLSKSRAWTSR